MINRQEHNNLLECTIIKTSFLQDTTLSLEARGFLAQVLSFPGIEKQPIPIMIELLGVKPCKARRILNELREHRYYSITLARNYAGQFNSCCKVFSDIPLYDLRELERIPKNQDVRRALIEADRNTPEPDLNAQITILELI